MSSLTNIHYIRVSIFFRSSTPLNTYKWKVLSQSSLNNCISLSFTLFPSNVNFCIVLKLIGFRITKLSITCLHVAAQILFWQII